MKRFLLILVILLASFLYFYRISIDPPSLFGDELDTGYQTYSIIKSGRDYQGNFMPVNFHSIAEWRTPLYVYSSIPTVAIFGVTPLGVRLPAAFFGVLSVLVVYLLVCEIFGNKNFALFSAFLLTISPWLLQFSRVGFEVTEMLFLIITGLWLFFKSLKNHKLFWLSIFCFTLSLWGYPTTKIFIPLLLTFLIIVYRKEILKMPKINLILSLFVGLIIGTPILFGTLFGGGTQRISDISIFSDPKMEQAIGDGRKFDNNKLIYSKYTYWGGEFINNYLESFSTNFLFVKGDTNLRQSIGTGEFLKIEFLFLIFGVFFFFKAKDIDLRAKFLIGFWLFISPIPAALTVDGGTHATRLILMLPVFVIFMSYGLTKIFEYKKYASLILVLICIFEFGFYIHNYYVVYPIVSEHWWHYGWKQSITEIKSIDKDYDRVIISMNGEPAWIFFAAYYQYSPSLWQKNFPIGRNVELPGFGKVSHIDKFYFGSPTSDIQIYGLGRYINSKTLYLANATEVGNNLILHPEGVPPGLRLIESIPFLNGDPAFYLFTGTAK